MAGSKMDVATGVGSGKATPLKIVAFVALGLAIVMLPILFQGFGQMYLVRILAVVGLYVLLALGLNIVVGYAGLLDLGYIAFYAIGGYAGVLVTQTYMFAQAMQGYVAAGGKVPPGYSPIQMLTYGPQFQAIATTPEFAKSMLHVTTSNALLPWMFFICIPISAAAAALAGIALGTPVLRLRGDYLAIVTLGFGEIVRIIITNNAFGITAGAAGLPRPGVILPNPAGYDFLSKHLGVTIPGLLGPRGFNFVFTPNMYWYYIIVLLCLASIFIIRRLDDSRLGRSWVAMREDEVAASSMGVNITAAKLWAFSLGALSGGIAGLVFVNLQGSVTPDQFTFMESVFVVSIVVLGGMGSIPGVIVGALIIEGIPALVQGLAVSGTLPLTATQISAVSNYRYLVFGALMVLMMALRPQGIIPSSRRARELQPESDEIAEEESETLYDAQQGTGGYDGDDL